MAPDSITLCIMARDESAVIRRCVESFAGAFNKLCVIDTGSTDDTPMIAKQLGATVISFTGCNGPDGRIMDFSAARNRYLDEVSGGWILQADADEILISEPWRVQRATAVDGCDTIGVEVESSGAKWCSVRLFRRDVVAKYVGRVHEIMLWRQPTRYLEDRSIAIANVENKASKESGPVRNIRIAETELALNPDNYRLRFFVGSALFKIGDHAAASECFRDVLASGRFVTGHFHATYYIGAAAMIAGDWQAAIAAGIDAISIDATYAEAYCLVADANFSAGHLDTALQYYHRAIECRFPPPNRQMAVQEWAYRDHPRKQINRIMKSLADKGGLL